MHVDLKVGLTDKSICLVIKIPKCYIVSDLCLSSSFTGYSIFSVQCDVKEFALLLQSVPSVDACWQGGHGRHARAAQSDHSIDVLGVRLGRHVNVPHQRERWHWRVVIRKSLEE